MRPQPAVSTLDVPEFLETYVRTKSAFGDVVIEQLQANPVSDYGRLADRDIGKWSGMHHTRLVFRGAAKRGVDGVSHPSCHRATYF
jgi:hypothetical protein